ncbi:1,3-beta-glucan synthase regulator [Paenibacillus faecalis]|uniref:1,3-beta-glucan synthase regulator n=1 Tax=Paenibacillus faecalis TaxID=2079532 RepID=UPI000D0E4775|nr:1,3-beta-glucan synthase regulator [Paenibacillus faecalis]
MRLLDNISEQFRIDASQGPSTEREIELLLEFSSITVPNDYLDIIRLATEIEISVAKEVYIRIWGATGCTEMNEAYQIQQYIPNSLAIGDDEGGRALIYLSGSKGFGLYIIGFGNLDIEDAVFIAPTLEDLLTKNIGIDNLLNL